MTYDTEKLARQKAELKAEAERLAKIEVEELRKEVSCALVLERNGYKLDLRESSRNSQKYRRAQGESIILNHEGRGWWDPHSDAKGDVFKLAQHLDPGLNFGQVRIELRALIGKTPANLQAERTPREREYVSPEGRWQGRDHVAPGSPTWAYLTQERGLSGDLIDAASRADVVRAGPYGSAWFAHRNTEGVLTGIEMRGPNYRGFSADGEKTLFRLQPGREQPSRLAVTEAPIDAMSLAGLEGMRRDTLYVSTAGGMGPGTIASLERAFAALAGRPGTVMVAATDADRDGERYAARLSAMAAVAGVQAVRAAPAGYKDWNDVLRARNEDRTDRIRPAASQALGTIVRSLDRPAAGLQDPWAPTPVALANRMRAIEHQDARRPAAELTPPSSDHPADHRAAPSTTPSPGAPS